MENTIVKLCSNASTKALIEEAERSKHEIEVEEDSFFVRDRKTNSMIFKGIKIRNNTWGLTFPKQFVQDSLD
jgi:hypothetical protein